MAQILQGQDLGERLGSGLGRGISEGLQQLAHEKLTKIAERNRYERNLKGLKALNFPNAEQAAHFDDKTIGQLAKQHQEQNAFGGNLDEFLGTSPQGAPQQIDESMITPEMKQDMAQFLQSPEAQQQYSPEQISHAMQQLNSLGGSPSQPQQQDANAKIKRYAKFVGQPKTHADRVAFAKEIEDMQAGRTPVSEKQQLQIDKSNKKFLDTASEYISNAQQRKQLAQDAIDIINSGETSSGLIGLLPERLLTSISDKNAELGTKLNALANAKSLSFRGPVGKAKLEAGSREKAKFSDPKEAQLRILQNEIRDATKGDLMAQAIEDIIIENDGRQPANFELKVRKRIKELEKEVPVEAGKEFKSLPKASEYPGRRIEFPDGSIRKSDGKSWIKEK